MNKFVEIIEIREMRTPQVHFICDRNKNIKCPRVKKNLPCGDCKGTEYFEYAKVFYKKRSMKTLMKMKIFSFYLKVKNLIKSMSEFNKIHLMDRVIYKGQIYFVNNGTKCDSNGNILWDIVPEDVDKDGKRSCQVAPRSEIRRVFCWFNIKNALFSKYHWWRMYWYKIHLTKMMDKYN